MAKEDNVTPMRKKLSIESAPDVFAHLTAEIQRIEQTLRTEMQSVTANHVTPEHIGALVQGGAAAIEARLQQHLTDIRTQIADLKAADAAEDAQERAEDAAERAEIKQALADIAAALKMLAAPQKRNITRTGTINLPSGPVTLTIKDS